MINVGLFRKSVVNTILVRMHSTKKSYEDAMCKLNALQSNKATLDQILKDMRNGLKCTNIENMENYLLRTGVTMAKLNQLSVIHVAGTKGKGSTSAMCESILRHHGYKTGFYSSPHLVAVRERIRLAGRVLSEDEFARYFHQVYDMLDATKAFEGDMPKYFAFLTVLAFNVFLQEKVDVAIVEVGIGGLVDSTNVVRNTSVVGITALGLDHTAILGNKLSQIAAAKAGIMKPGCEAYTVRQPPEAMEVLENVASDVKCTLNVVPDYNTYQFPYGYKTHLQANLEAYKTNASLAVQLAHSWLRLAEEKYLVKNTGTKEVINKKGFMQNYKEFDSPYSIKEQMAENRGLITVIPLETAVGLQKCKWPGRYHVVDAAYATFYLDGAHTKESMEICSSWFSHNSNNHENILLFSATGDRDAATLLGPLATLNFKHIYFAIPTAYKQTHKHNDNYSVVEHKDLVARCHRNSEIWTKLTKDFSATRITVVESVSEALISIKNTKDFVKPSVLVTGSLHLVGATLSIIDSSLSSS